MFYECLIELSSYGCIGEHLSRFQQLVVFVKLASYNMHKITVPSPAVLEMREPKHPVLEPDAVRITCPASSWEDLL